MAWLSSSDWICVDIDVDVACSFESSMETRVRLTQTPLYINGVKQEEMVEYEQAYEVELRRSVTTRSETTLYEMRGLTQSAATALVSETISYNPLTEAMSSTVIKARRVNEANGWMATKRITSVSVTRGQWAFFAEVKEYEET